MGGQVGLRAFVVGCFETGGVEGEDGVVWEVGGCVAGLQAEDRQDENCDAHEFGEDC